MWVLTIVSLFTIAIYGSRLRHSLASAVILSPTANSLNLMEAQFPKVSVIIPAYNEAENIHECITVVLDSTQLPGSQLEVLVVDDQSTDETLLLAQSLQELLNDPRLFAIGYKLSAGVANPLDLLAAAVATIAIFFHYDLRRVSSEVSQIPTAYWWLGGIGGTIVAALAVASVIKIETGWGWTWRGRSLKP